VVEEVFLELVEDDVYVPAEQLLPRAQSVGERCVVVRCRQRPTESTGHFLGDRCAQRCDGMIAPVVEDDDRELGLSVPIEVLPADFAQMMGHPGPEHGALPHTGLAVHDSQS
jgi:hypothetical protein